MIFTFSSLLAYSQEEPDCCYEIPASPTTFGAQLDSRFPIPPYLSKDTQITANDLANSSYILNKPIVADIDGDGTNEILSYGVTKDSMVTREATNFGVETYYGSDIIQIRSMSSPNVIKTIEFHSTMLNLSNLAVADLDNNPLNGLEIVAVDEDMFVHIISDISGINGVGALTFNDKKLVAHRLNGLSVVPNIANLDGLGRPEIIVGDHVFFWDVSIFPAPAWNSVIAGNGTSGPSGARNTDTTYATSNGNPPNYPPSKVTSRAYKLPLAIDVLPSNPGLELILGPDIYSFLNGSLNRIYDMNSMITNLNQFNITPNGLYDGFVSAGNLDADPNIEIAINGSVRFNNGIRTGIYIIDPVDNVIEAFISADTSTCTNSSGITYSFSGSAVTIADIDDAFPGAELIYLNTGQITAHNLSVGSTSNYETWNTPLKIVDCSGMTGITTFDFNSDGIKELVYRDEEDLRILYGGTDSSVFPGVNNTNTDRNWFIWQSVISRTGVEYPTIVDLDNDGEAEIVTYGSGFEKDPEDVLGYLMVIESATATTPWGPASPIWNQAQYFYRNINSDGTVPVSQLSQNTDVNGQKPYNIFLGQPNLIANDTIWKPDVNINVLEKSCDFIKIKLCNTCNIDIPAGMPVTAYNNSPLLNANSSIVNQQVTSEIIQKNGGCITMIIPTNNIPGDYYIVANDDGSSTLPFNLSTDFPNTNIIECSYDTNIANAMVTCTSPPFPECCENKLELAQKRIEQINIPDDIGWNAGVPLSITTDEFTITNPSLIPITELRAVVTDFNFKYNYDSCATCVDNPALWASIDNANTDNIGDADNGLELVDYNGSILNDRINQREIIWRNDDGTMLQVGDKFSIAFALPPMSEIPCCATSVEICIEISYKDANCKVCTEPICVIIDLNAQSEKVGALEIDVKKKDVANVH